jgi:hypothetical protein
VTVIAGQVRYRVCSITLPSVEAKVVPIRTSASEDDTNRAPGTRSASAFAVSNRSIFSSTGTTNGSSWMGVCHSPLG